MNKFIERGVLMWKNVIDLLQSATIMGGFIDDEVTALEEHAEYLNSILILDQNKKQARFRVETLEDQIFVIVLNQDGFLIDGTDQIYPTLQSLLMDVSKEYTRLFHQKLISKLQNIE